MSAASLRTFLDGIGLAEYFDLLSSERVEPTDLAFLTDADLAALGMPLGPRRRLLHAARSGALEASTEAKVERRNLTVLFCDLAGSTAIASRVDPEDLRAIYRTYRSACVALIEAEGGFVAHSFGDGLMAHFGYPRALEDAAIRAVRAGLGLVAEVGRIVVADNALRARVGIATGMTVVEEGKGDTLSREEMATGATLSLAARLQAHAPPGGVVLSDATRRLLGGAFELRALGREPLKGFAEPETIWLAVGEARMPSRFDATLGPHAPSPLTGRDKEHALLLETWRRSLRGEGGALLLAGEPGIGKSRLLAELRAEAAPAAETVLLQCSPYRRGTALHPVTDWIDAMIGRVGDAPEEERQARLDALAGTKAATRPLLAQLMGLGSAAADHGADPAARQEAMLAAVTDMLAQAPASGARLVLVEDVHWADAATLDVLDRLAGRTSAARLMLVMTARPDMAGMPENPAIRRIALERLPQDAADAMVADLAGADRLPASLRRMIADRSGGVPLFVEELTRAILEAPDTAASDVPATLQDTLMARLDRLPAGKPVAQLGALIGRSFPDALIEAASDLPPPMLRRGLEELVAAGLLEAQEGAERGHAFRHALVRDVAYGSMVRARRASLHGTVARTLEDRFPMLAEAQPDIVAHHYTEAGDLDAAVPRWEKAAEQAISRASPISAISHFKTALDLLGRKPDPALRNEQEAALRIRLNMPLTMVTGFASADTEANLRRMTELFELTAPTVAALQVLWSTCMSALVRADLVTAKETALRLQHAAARSDLPNGWRMPERMLGYVAMIEGELDLAQRHFGKVLEGYAPRGFDPILPGHPFDVLAASLSQRAITMALMGRPSAVDRDQGAALARARSLESPATSFQVLVHLCIARFELGDHDGALPLLRDLQDVVERHEVARPYTDVWDGWRQARQGELDAGLARMRRAQEEGTNYPLWMPGTVMMMADLLQAADRHEEALHVLEACETDIRRLRHTYLLAELMRRRARSLSALGAPPTACEPLLTEAVAVAERQGARRFELAARRDLARHRQASGDAAAAALALLPIRRLEGDCRALAEFSAASALLAALGPQAILAAERGSGAPRRAASD